MSVVFNACFKSFFSQSYKVITNPMNEFVRVTEPVSYSLSPLILNMAGFQSEQTKQFSALY